MKTEMPSEEERAGARYQVALLSFSEQRNVLIALEQDIDSGAKPYGVFNKYWNMTSPRARPKYEGDPYDFDGDHWMASVIGISQHMVDVLVDYAKKHGIVHKELPA